MAFRTNKTPVLQEKTASGSIATFNTALAMPLVSCNIAVNAWQEGSGDPSPSNVRPIHGWTKSNLANMSDSTKVQFFKGLLNGTYYFVDLGSLAWGDRGNSVFTSSRIPNAPMTVFNIICAPYTTDNSLNNVTILDYDKVISSRPSYNNQIVMIRDTYYSDVTVFKNAMSGVYLIYELATPTTPTITKAQFEMLLNAFGISGKLYTMQLGEEIFGAEVDFKNGVAHVTHAISDMGDLSWSYRSDNFCFYVSVNGMKDYVDTTDYADTMNEMFKFGGVIGLASTLANLNYYVRSSTNSHMILVRWDDYTTASDFKNAVTGKKLLFELAEPFDIQLTPTQIETLIGNNTIFADTGDVDLTFNDLDIAKRGSFREVFKLP